MAKRLFLIGGTMGVGKSATGQALKNRLDRCVYLDGDWCWDMHPFQITEETKRMVMDNICHTLNGFLSCSAFENVIFCWVMHEQSLLDQLLFRLRLDNWQVICVSLVCSPETLIERLRQDVAAGIRTADVIDRSLSRLPLYNLLSTVKLDVSALSPKQAAERIAGMKPAAPSSEKNA